MLTTTPDPTDLTLPTSTVLKDTATLSAGSNPTGTMAFTLHGPNNVLVDTETVPVTGNGSYSTSVGYALPSSGTVAGIYQWKASYSGDTTNRAVFETGVGSEQVTVRRAPTALVTHATVVGQPNSVVTFFATLSNQSNGMGIAGQAITFTQTGPLVALLTLTGGHSSCTGVTDVHGVASCSLNEVVKFAILIPRYSAAFGGNTDYLPVSSMGTLRAP